MAKMGANITGMSDVQGSNIFRMNVQEGVVDKSAAMYTQATTGLIGNVGEEVLSAHKGYALAGLEQNVETEIDKYMAPRRAETARQESEALRFSVEKMWENPDVTIEDVNPVEKQIQSRLKSYKEALDQGVMSPDQFTTRILSVTREAINKNPGLAKELRTRASDIMELSGISSYVEADKEAMKSQLKAQEKMQEELRSLGDKLEIPFNRFAPDYLKLQQDINVIQREKGIVAAADRATSFDEAQFRNYGTTYMVGKYNDVKSQAIAIMSDESMPYDKRIATVKLSFNNLKAAIANDGRINRIIDKPAVQSSIKFINDLIDTTNKTLEGFSSKDDAKKFLDNISTMSRNQDYLNYTKAVGSPLALEATTKILSTVYAQRLITENPDILKKAQDSLSNMASGVAGALGTSYDILGDNGQNIITGAVGSLAQDAGKGNASGLHSLEKSADVIYQDLQNPEKFKTTGDKFKFLSSYTKELGKPENKEGIKKLDDVSRMKMTSNLTEYIDLTLGNIQERTSFWEKQGAKIQWDILPDGRLTLHTDNVSAMQDLTSSFVIRTNDSIKALANLMDTSIQGAAGIFFTRHKEYFTTKETNIEKEIGDVVANIHTVEDALTAFNKGKITNQEYRAIVKDIKLQKKK